MDRRYTASSTLTLDDYRVLCRACARLTPFRRWMRWVHAAMLIGFAVAAAAFAWAGDWETSLFIAGILALIAVLTYVVRPWQMQRQFDNQRLGASAIDFVADETGLETRSAFSEGRSTWAAIQKVDELPEHVILWPNDRIGFILPRRGFASPELADAFVALAREKVA